MNALPLWQALRRHPSGWLLAAQLFAVLLYPFLDGSSGGRVIFVLFGNLVLALVLWVVIRSPVVNWASWFFAAPAVGLSLISLVMDSPQLRHVSHLLEAIVYLYAATGLIFYMLSDYRVTFDEILAAGATFTLLAWGFAFCYSACQGWLPGSFTIPVGAAESRTWMELLFMSFSILSGVGLSDITPVHPFARALVMLEMFCGVMYIAVVVSRLIALTTIKAKMGE
jgi:hypothetical protein